MTVSRAPSTMEPPVSPRRKSLPIPGAAGLAVLWWCLAGPAAAQSVELPDPRSAIDAEIAASDDPEIDADATPEFPPGFDSVIAVIAIDPLNPRLDPDEPWAIAPGGRVIPRRRASRAPIPVFKAPLHDAFSTRRDDSGIELTFGGQPALGGSLGMRVNRLEIEPTVVELRVGESFDLDELTVRAYDAPGELVERAPLRLEIEGPQGFVDMAAFERDGTTLTASARGVGRIWVTSLLPARLGDPFTLPVVVNVRELDSPGVRLSSRIYENVPATP